MHIMYFLPIFFVVSYCFFLNLNEYRLEPLYIFDDHRKTLWQRATRYIHSEVKLHLRAFATTAVVIRQYNIMHMDFFSAL